MGERKSISELPASTVQLITATQIATSVSNIVKELVENSLDAGSTVIRVKLENSGLDKIEVIDNGSGVSKEDATKMGLPHFTSKISQHHDLESLTTYGFRGEALAAVCAVAKVSVTTKTATDPVASTYSMDSKGNVTDIKPSHLSQGTMVVATSLFWNVPVRKQVYQTAKKKKEELVKVEELLLNFGLIHPELHLSFHHDHSLIWQKSRAADFKSNIQQILGHAVTSHMEFVTNDEPVDLFLMVPKRSAPIDLCFRHKQDRCFTFVNQRPIISKDIEKLMKELYAYAQEGQKTKLYPIYLVSLQLPGEDVDVNLEPNKTKVLLKHQADVTQLINATVGKILGLSALSPLKPAGVTGDSFAESDVSVVNETNVSDCDVVEDDALFRGFDEPFGMPTETESSNSNKPKSITVGSAEWSKGLATDTDGRIVHPVVVLRGQPHFAKRLPDPPLLSSVAKRPKLFETLDASRIVGSDSSQLEMVNGKVRKVPSDAYGEYCKEMSDELLSQNPLLNFNELSQQLSQGWKNLDNSSREKYEERSESNRQKYAVNRMKETPKKLSAVSNTSLDRYLLGSQTPIIRAPTKVPAVAAATVGLQTPLPKTSSIRLEFSLASLAAALDTSIPASADSKWCRLKKLCERCWLCSNGQEIIAVNFDRLYELILFDRLSEETILPSKCLSIPIEITPRILNDPGLWDVMTSLSTEWETATTDIVNDPRLVTNGLGVRMCKDGLRVTSAQIFKVPANFPSFDVIDLTDLLRCIAEESSTVKSCRPHHCIQNMKMEAAKLAKDRCTEPDEEELCELLQQWLSTDPENNCCLHGEPVIWSYFLFAEGES